MARSLKKIELDDCFEALGVTQEMYDEEDRKKNKLGLISHFLIVGSERHLLVVNSHNHHHPMQDVIKYAEIAYLLNETNSELERIRKEYNTNNISVMMLGDYNSRPESVTYAMVKHRTQVDYT